ncbi:hypothetical protein BP5796_12539 [Coleophoma crateriformis]|uniref:Uncharacterized protein n=1 Tax=Coleophoma crateriformis TaxID=565419 RepID=A0A3D8Q7Y5_9HELO|nr:hypothetical protein BP5796_12539 [Coleophoma crateriformis]
MAQSTNNVPSKKRSIISHNWTLEILSGIAAIVLFVGLISVLRMFDGQHQQDWRYTHFTRNAVVGAFITIIRMLLLIVVTKSLSQNKWTWFSSPNRIGHRFSELESFDDASRGFLGSIRLLGVVKVFHIASMGALVIILVIGLDTFVQNVLGIKYFDVTLVGPSNVGTIPRRETYGYKDSVPTSNYFVTDVSLNIKNAITTGAIGINATTPSLLCSTGNCVWPVVPSLAMCGECTNVTEYLTITRYENYQWLRNLSLPDSSFLIGPVNNRSVLADVPLAFFNVTNTAGYIYNETTDQASGLPSRMYAAQFSMIANAVNDITNGSISASECALWFCVKAYKYSVVSGVVQLEQTNTTSAFDLAEPWPSGALIENGVPVEPVTYDSSLAPDGLGLFRNFTNLPANDFNVPPGMVFGATYANAFAINRTVASVVNGNVSYDPFHVAWNHYSDAVQTLYQSRQNPNLWIQNLARSITVALQSNVGINGTTSPGSSFDGVAHTTITLIAIRWQWMIYPSVLIVLGILHLFVTIWQTRKGPVDIWKNDILAPLLIHVKDKEGKLLSLTTNDKLLKILRKYNVTLTSDKDGQWSFQAIEDYEYEPVNTNMRTT